MEKLDRKRAGKAYQEATKQLDKEKTEKVKALVIDTMRALDKANEDRRAAVKRQQVLRQDLADLRQGRLDKVVERHRKDKEADKASPVTEQRLLSIISQPPVMTSGYMQITGNSTNYIYDPNATLTVTNDWLVPVVGGTVQAQQPSAEIIKMYADAVRGTYAYDNTVRSI